MYLYAICCMLYGIISACYFFVVYACIIVTSSFEGGRPRPELSPCASPNKWRSADDPHIRTASLAQLTTLEGGCLGGGRNPLAVASLWRVYAERSRVQVVVWWTCRQLRKPEALSDHRGGLLLNYWWQRTLFCRGVRVFVPALSWGLRPISLLDGFRERRHG